MLYYVVKWIRCSSSTVERRINHKATEKLKNHCESRKHDVWRQNSFERTALVGDSDAKGRTVLSGSFASSFVLWKIFGCLVKTFSQEHLESTLIKKGFVHVPPSSFFYLRIATQKPCSKRTCLPARQVYRDVISIRDSRNFAFIS